MDGIAVGRDDRSNTIIFYNPISKSYYRPPAFRLDESRSPTTNFPKSVRFDGGLTCGLLRYRTDPIHEPFPPGTRVTVTHDSSPTRGTVQNVPLPFTPNLSTSPTPDDPQSVTYTIHLDNGSIIDASFEDISPLFPPVRPPSNQRTKLADSLLSFSQTLKSLLITMVPIIRVTSCTTSQAVFSSHPVAMPGPRKLIGWHPCLTSLTPGPPWLAITYSSRATLPSAHFSGPTLPTTHQRLTSSLLRCSTDHVLHP